ncbi:MAG: Tab2/Atab2 family RNA-binding protein [Leptolyngbyaceae cyanobacterium bins.349]|nr:Tab2/Atab2 family RNA-binding protein [Leptolyngbyaceae cyanobacterium bins.349]
MTVWEIDFYRRPLQDEAGHVLWEWVVCDATGTLRDRAFCPQTQASADWVSAQLAHLLKQYPQPQHIRAFRPQTLNLLESACRKLGIALQPTRRTPQLKQYLLKLAGEYPQMSGYLQQPYDPLALDQPPPLPLDETLLGQQWQFAALPAGDLVDAFAGRMIPVLELPDELLPLNLGLPSTLPIPGVIIQAGRRSLRLAQWVQAAAAIALKYIPGAPDGLILEAGLVDRWIIATFEDADVIKAAQTFEQRKQLSQGLHFLLVQPDDSGMTYSGFWLLRQE